MKTSKWFALLLVLALTLSACVAPAAAPSAAPGEAAAPTVSEMHIAWPYSVPPTGHFNTFVTNGLSLAIYQALMEPPLFYYMWADASWMPIAGESWEWVDA